MKRVLVGGLHHESNTFNPILTGWTDIRIRRGTEITEKIEKDSIGGIVKTLLDAGYEVVPTLIARAVPNGEWEEDVYRTLKEELLTAVREAGPLDAICLSLHGSMRVKGLGEAEGDLLTSIRELQPTLPLVTSLDMHATITDEMIAAADAFVGYKCAPHTDTFETGIHAASMIVDILEKGAEPCMEVLRIPMIVAGEQSETNVEPMKSLIEGLRKEEKREHIMAASYLLGFPWADTAPNSVTALVVTDGNRALAKETCLRAASSFWNRRNEFCFYTTTLSPPEALEAALKAAHEHAPAVISDSGDNPTAGSSGDVTNFLKLILREPRAKSLDPPLLYQCFYDPSLVERALALGAGNSFNGSLGGCFDTQASSPVTGELKVKQVKRNWDGCGVDLALIHVDGVDVVVSSRHVGAYDPLMMRSLGVNPEELKVIVVKLGYLEPEIKAISRFSVMALTDGASNEALWTIDYRCLPRPVFPLERNTAASWE